MSRWKYDIEGCDGRFEDVKSAAIHQTVDHERHECKVCGTVVPEGYFAIRHAFDEHTRVEFVRVYDVDSPAVHIHGGIKNAVKVDTGLNSVVETLHERDAL